MIAAGTQSKLLYTRDLTPFTACHIPEDESNVLSKQTNQSMYHARIIKLEGP